MNRVMLIMQRLVLLAGVIGLAVYVAAYRPYDRWKAIMSSQMGIECYALETVRGTRPVTEAPYSSHLATGQFAAEAGLIVAATLLAASALRPVPR